MNIIGGDGTNGYKRTRPGRSFAISIKPKKIVGLHKKASAPAHRFESQILNRTERVMFGPCEANKHRSCASVIIQDDGTLPKTCSCDCHRGKKRRRFPTQELAANGPNVDAVNQVYINDGKMRVAEAEKEPIKLHDSLKALYASHAAALSGGANFDKTSGKISLPRYFTMYGKRHAIQITRVGEIS